MANSMVCHVLHPWLEGNSPHFQLLIEVSGNTYESKRRVDYSLV
jgi:hypothetical protein